MTKTEAGGMMCQLEGVFETVRLVDEAVTTQYRVDGLGELRAEPCRCDAAWNGKGRCEHCVASKAFARKGKLTEFFFAGQEVYCVIAMYLEVEGAPFVLEMGSHITDETRFGAWGQNELGETISSYQRRLYGDPLTGAYNRLYYQDRLADLEREGSAAILDVDDFKGINDAYGHLAGDLALKAVVRAILSCVRSSDTVIRYGGDEFLIFLQNIPRDKFGARLEAIRQSVRDIVLEEYPGLRLSVSIGGVFHQGGDRDLLRRADKLLYRAKEEKNAVCWE